MQHQSQLITQQLLAPLNAVYQDVQKNLQMELDVERVALSNEQQAPASSWINKQDHITANPGTVEETASAKRVENSADKSNTAHTVSNSSPTANILTTASPAANQTLPITAVTEAKASMNLNQPESHGTPGNTPAVVRPVSNQNLPIISVAESKVSTNLNLSGSHATPDNNPAVDSSPFNQTLSITPVTQAKTSTTVNQVSHVTQANHPEPASLPEYEVIRLTPVENSGFATNNAVQQANIMASNPTALGAEQHKTSASAYEAKVTDSLTQKIVTETAKAQMTPINSPAILIPLRNPPAENITTATPSLNVTQGLPSATANRLKTAVDPVLQQAYQLTQQQLQCATTNSSELAATGLVRNTFNVSVAMNNQNTSDTINLADFEQALSDVLVKAARRQGLEV